MVTTAAVLAVVRTARRAAVAVIPPVAADIPVEVVVAVIRVVEAGGTTKPEKLT